MSSYATSDSANNMVSFSVEYLSTPSRYNQAGGAGTDPDTDSSTSPGNNTSGSSPNLHLAPSGEDAVESPPLKTCTPAAPRRPAVSSPSDPEEDPTSSTSSEDKPAQSYIALISMAILQHPQKKMLLGDIYQFIMDKFPHYRNTPDKAWRNSIRHNLSINECFIKAGRADNGKGNFWAIHPACEEDFGKGDFRRRQARRRARRSQQVNVSKMPLTYRYSLGYVPMKSTPTSGVSGAQGASFGGPVRGAYGVTVASGGTTGARLHPYATPQRPGRHQHTQHHQQHLQTTGYSHMSSIGAGGMSGMDPTAHHHMLQHQHQQLHATPTSADYAQYYGSLSFTQSSPYNPNSANASRVSPLQGCYPSPQSAVPSTSPTLLSGSYLQPTSPGSADSPNLLELGSYHNHQHQHHSASTTSLEQQLHPTSQSSTPHAYTTTTTTSSCLYQPQQGDSPPGFNPSPTGPVASPVTISQTGGAYPFSSGLSPMCFSDMPALRDAINGLTGLSSL